MISTRLMQGVLAASVLTQNVLSAPSLVPFVYDEIPLGSITPNGWLRAEMETEAAGLAGHLYDFYSFVHDSSWLGGTQEYSGLNEAFPYWLNGLIPLAYTLNDQRLKDQVHEAMQYLLDNMIADDGWIGPETGGYRLLWARTLIFFAWTPLVDANKTWEEPLVSAMHNFNSLMNSMLKNNGTGLVPQKDGVLDDGYYFWFLSRVAEMIVSLQWLYEKYPQGQEKMILENMEMLHHYGYKWEDWFEKNTYAFGDLYDQPNAVTDDNFQFLHGVNVGEGLKAAAVIRRYTHNDSLIQTARDGVNWTFQYHGAASGTILADEREDGLDPYYGSETCTAVEVTFSQSYNYRALGESFYADGSELAAYNALPGAMTGDWWAHVYMSQPNQPYSKNLTKTPFFDVNTMGQTYGLEPNYPCCTVNHPQGLPKFVQSAYVTSGSRGLVHALLSPASVTTQLNGGTVSVDCETHYPFSDTLSYTIQSSVPFDFYMRQPTWASHAIINHLSTFDSSTGLHKVSLPAGQSSLQYKIPTSLRTSPRANDTIAIYHGALLYALEVNASITSTGPHGYRNMSLYPSDYAPPQVRDYIMTNTSAWNIAIDPSTLKYHNSMKAGDELPMPIFASGAPPMHITAKACLIDWPLFKESVPGAPIPKSERKCQGGSFVARFVPYGSAKVRMTDIPTIDL